MEMNDIRAWMQQNKNKQSWEELFVSLLAWELTKELPSMEAPATFQAGHDHSSSRPLAEKVKVMFYEAQLVQ